MPLTPGMLYQNTMSFLPQEIWLTMVEFSGADLLTSLSDKKCDTSA